MKKKQGVVSLKREGEREGKWGRRRMADVAGGKEQSVWATAPPRHRALNPLPQISPPLLHSLLVLFAMVTRQDCRCSRLMCFSATGVSWVLMCLSLLPAQSMSTVLGWTNTWRRIAGGHWAAASTTLCSTWFIHKCRRTIPQWWHSACSNNRFLLLFVFLGMKGFVRFINKYLGLNK